MAYSDTRASETYPRTGLAIQSEQDNWRLQPSPVGPALSLEAESIISVSVLPVPGDVL